MNRHRNKFEILNEVLIGKVICNTGQVGPDTVLSLNRMVKAGTLLRWRGKWFPVAGAAFGIGPDKTCWGLTSKYGCNI